MAAEVISTYKSALKPVDSKSKSQKTVEIPIGSSVTGIAETLEKNGIIKNAKVFKYYVKLKNEGRFYGRGIRA